MIKCFEKVFVFRCGLILWALLNTSLAFAQYDEADLKAVYLYRFALLADWVATGKPATPVEYCVSESDTVAKHLKHIVARKPQLSRYFNLATDVNPSTCHILYIPDAKQAQIAALREAFPHSLLIGNGEKFVFMGGMLAFVKVNNRIRPMVSRRHVELAGVQLRAQLLSISILAEERGEP